MPRSVLQAKYMYSNKSICRVACNYPIEYVKGIYNNLTCSLHANFKLIYSLATIFNCPKVYSRLYKLNSLIIEFVIYLFAKQIDSRVIQSITVFVFCLAVQIDQLALLNLTATERSTARHCLTSVGNKSAAPKSMQCSI